MELREFISESLSQILNGIEDAHAKLEGESHYPRIYHVGQIRHDNFDQTEKIDFEVLVNVEASSSTGGGAKINVLALTVGVEADQGSKHIHQNKIKFSVPVCFTKAERNTKKPDKK